MPWKAVRKFNGAVDPYWSTPEGVAEWGGYATFDHHLGGGSFNDAINAVRAFLGDRSLSGREQEYSGAMLILSDPTPGHVRFVYDQDVFEISESSEVVVGVRNFHDPRLTVSFQNGKIVRSDGKVRRGWRWI
jgi:hypothetical protein